MDNKEEKKSEHDFVVKSTSASSSSKNNSGKSTLKTILISLTSGIVGAALVLGLCLYVPNIRTLLDSDSSDSSTKKSVSKIFTSEGAVNTGIDLSEYSDTAISVANKVLPSVVGIEVTFSISANYHTFLTQDSSTSTATGSGVIISEDGYILTNNHIVDASSSSSSYYTVSDAKKVVIYLYDEDEPIDAEIVGTDSVTDLAILKIDRDGLTPATIGDSDSVQVGEFAMAIGNPLDMRSTVTSGIISGLNREIEDENGTMYTLIQTDAAINSGNSGGALVNADGELIGINTLKMSGTGIEGMGFAIPINSTLDITEQLISTGKVSRPYIGISGINVTETYSQYYNLPIGVYVAELQKDGPAKDSDLEVGDVIIEFNGEKIESMSQLNKEKNKCEIGDEITLKVSRNGEELEIKITLIETP
ncbi:MAG: S1C family serine protease [Clostridia bacterium]